MSETNPTKDELATALADARAENAELRKAVAAGGPAAPYRVAQTFQLSQGDLFQLETYGVLAIGGQVYTREEVIDRLPENQKDLEIAEPAPGLDQRDQVRRSNRPKVEGVDFIRVDGIPAPDAAPVDPADDEPAGE